MMILCTSRPERLAVVILGMGVCLLVVYQKIVYDEGFLDRRELYTERLKKILEHTSLQWELTLIQQNMTHNDRLLNMKTWEYHEQGKNEKDNGNKYLIYLCNKHVPCGDWGVRQFGIMSTYLLANVTHRIFKLSMTSPCRMEQFLMPSDVNWLPDINELRGKSLHVVNDVDNSSFLDVIKAENFNDVYSQDIVFVRATANLMDVIKQNPFYKGALPEWAHSNNSALFTDAWNRLVKPTPYLKNKLQYLLNRIPFVHDSSTCAYIQPGNITRMFPSTIRNIILLLDKITKSMVFLSTGSEELGVIFRKRYNNTCVVSGGHVDDVRNTTDLCVGLETTHQETIFQEYQATKHKERSAQLQQYYEQIVAKTQTELSALKSHLKVAKKDLDGMKKKHNELAERLSERSRQYQKLQSLYESLRRRCITPSVFSERADALTSIDQTASKLQNFTMNLTTGDSLRSHMPSFVESGKRPTSPPERDFNFRPNNTPVLSEQNSCRFNMPLGTPSAM